MKLSLAGINVEAATRLEFVERLTADYRSEAEGVDLSVEVTDEDIKNEAAMRATSFKKYDYGKIKLYQLNQAR